MKFKEWLVKETGTSTGDVAGFSRRVMQPVTREWPKNITTSIYGSKKEPNEKKKITMQPQVKESKNKVSTGGFMTMSELMEFGKKQNKKSKR